MFTLAEWVASLQMQAARTRGDETTREVERTLGHLAESAQDLIGRENSGWQELAESTVEGKQRLGYTGQRSATDPLLRTGVLESSISAGASRNGLTIKGVIGSDDEVAIYQEMGTSRIPPRPFLAKALIEGQQVIEEAGGQYLVRVLMNRE